MFENELQVRRGRVPGRESSAFVEGVARREQTRQRGSAQRYVLAAATDQSSGPSPGERGSGARPPI